MANFFSRLIIEPGTRVKLADIFPSYRRPALRETALRETTPAELHPRVRSIESLPLPPHMPITLPDPQHEFLVAPGSRVRLADIDPARGRHDPVEAAMAESQALIKKLDRLQYLMHAERKHSLLIILQGLDACGKDGVIRHVLSGMNPAGCRVVGFKKPRQEELDHDFLWRVHPHLPAKGEVTIFNRSHYEDVLVVRVHQFVHADSWDKRYGLINDFERMLVTENDTTVLKFFLYISKEEQLARFKQRLDDPARRWKISEADYRERAHWNRYTEAFEEMLSRTSTPHSPWFVIPSNLKWFRDLAVAQIVTRTLENLDMKCPEPAVDIAEIRRRYHAAANLEEAQAS